MDMGAKSSPSRTFKFSVAGAKHGEKAVAVDKIGGEGML